MNKENIIYGEVLRTLNTQRLYGDYLSAISDQRFHLIWPDRDVDILVRPSVIPKLTRKTAYEGLKPRLQALTSAVEKVGRAFRQYPDWAVSLGFPESDMKAINSLPFVTPYWMARFDLFVKDDSEITGGTGAINVWSPEWNSNIPGGSAWSQLIKRMLESHYPQVNLSDYLTPMATSLRAYEKIMLNRSCENLAMVVDPKDRSEMDLLAALLVEEKHFEKVVIVSNPQDFKYINYQLYVQTSKGLIPTNTVFRKEKAQRMMRGERGREYSESPLWEALRQQNAILLNPLDSYLLASRLLYPVMYEAAVDSKGEFDQRLGHLTTDEQGAVLNIIPPSFILRSETIQRLKDMKGQAVVKTDGSCGANVYLPNQCNVLEMAQAALKIPGSQAIMQQVMMQYPYTTLVADETANTVNRDQLVVGGFDPYVFHTPNVTVVSDAVISRFQPIGSLDELPVKANVGNPERPARLAICGFI